MSEELAHYSAKPLRKITGRVQKFVADMKPSGFWVSDDGCEQNWRAWCEGERFAVENLVVRTRVFLRADANVLRIDTIEKLDAFSKEYGAGVVDSDRTMAISWRRVADAYQGIIISPYFFARRFSLFWYYGWDCASGCIWDVHAIADLVEVKS